MIFTVRKFHINRLVFFPDKNELQVIILNHYSSKMNYKKITRFLKRTEKKINTNKNNEKVKH